MPLLSGDDFVPALDNANDLGETERRWQSLYVSDNIYGANVIHEDNLSVTNTPTDNQILSYAGNNRFTWVDDANYDTLSGLSCSNGQIAVYNSATTSWACGDQTDDSDTLDGLSCANGQTITYSSTTESWVCADQITDTLDSLSCAQYEIIRYNTTTESWECISICAAYNQSCSQ
jgi:hypothetical protein